MDGRPDSDRVDEFLADVVKDCGEVDSVDWGDKAGSKPAQQVALKLHSLWTRRLHLSIIHHITPQVDIRLRPGPPLPPTSQFVYTPAVKSLLPAEHSPKRHFLTYFLTYLYLCLYYGEISQAGGGCLTSHLSSTQSCPFHLVQVRPSHDRSIWCK